MQTTPSNPLVPRSGRLQALRSLVVALMLVGVGTLLAWVLLGTSLVLGLIRAGHGSTAATIGGVIAWLLAIVLPACLVVMGVIRLFAVLDATGRLSRRPASTLRHALRPGQSAIADLVLPDGRLIRNVLTGAFGAVVVGDVPPPSGSRTDGMRWEVLASRGTWVPVESPAERAVRDSERLRAWFVADDRDFVITVRAVLATDDPRVHGSAVCPVIDPEDLGGWLASLPVQRSLTETRLARLQAMVRAASAGKVTRR